MTMQLKRRTTRASVLLRVGIAAEAKLPQFTLERFRSCCIRCWVEHAFQACIPRLQKGRGFSREVRALVTSAAKAEFRGNSQMHR